MEKIVFDNHDTRIKYYPLFMERKDLENIPQYDLPEGYRFVFYQPGDRDAWIAIEMSAKEANTYEQGLEFWNQFFGGKDEELVNRMVFIETEEGEKIATATALYDDFGRDKTNAGWLHWVAIKREHQGKKLARPLVSHTLQVMKELGYDHAQLSTQTCTWVACKLYLNYGFRPLFGYDENGDIGWRMVKTLTQHPALAEYADVSMEEIVTLSSVIYNKHI